MRFSLWNSTARFLFSFNYNCNCNISTSAILCYSNHYEALGISPDSTQADIKAAYYNLSKVYHPDKNQGSEEAAKKFREISQAYEVLGNYKSRRLYDKGIIQSDSSSFRPHAESQPDIEDDPQTKFYKSRFKKSRVADVSGRTPIYDFDEWSRQHYGKSFQRRQEAKERYDRKQEQAANYKYSYQTDFIFLGLLFVFLLGTFELYITESSYDTPININKEDAKDESKATDTNKST